MTQQDPHAGSEPKEDLELIDAARDGDREAMHELGRRFYGYVVRSSIHHVHVLRLPLEHEDLAQQSWLRVLNGLRGFRGDSAFTTWLTIIVRRTALNMLRSQRRRPATITTATSTLTSTAIDQDPIDPVTMPDEQVVDHVVITDAILRLEPVAYATFVARSIQAMTWAETRDEVARTVGSHVSEWECRTAYRTAVSALRQALDMS